MDQIAPLLSLPLDPISPRLPVGEPFTAAAAARAGIGRAVLARLLREGRVRRLVRGVYLDATVPVTRRVRARSLALVVGGDRIVVGATAAWLHGVEVSHSGPSDLQRLEVHGGAARPDRRPLRYADRDLEVVEGVRCTTPLRTALDLGRGASPERAIAALDGLLALGAFSHPALMGEVARFGGRPGIGQLRELAAVADARAEGAAESVLRLRWLGARLPTPSPGLAVPLPGPGGRAVRLALGLEVHRFGVVLAGRQRDADLAALAVLGWRVVVLGSERVLRGDPAYLVGHLEREFHQHLLDQVG
jgi:hypothetical protein